LDFAKASVRNGVGLEQDFDGFFVAYDGFWTRHRIADDVVRCQLPEDTAAIKQLPDCARDCWKLLMFRKEPKDVEDSVNLLFPLLKNDEIRSFKHNADAALDPDNDYVIVIYTWGIEERDSLKAKLHSLGFTNIPYRRGCKMFESRFGHWKQWFRDER
jgi:hypothetical protein